MIYKEKISYLKDGEEKTYYNYYVLVDVEGVLKPIKVYVSLERSTILILEGLNAFKEITD